MPLDDKNPFGDPVANEQDEEDDDDEEEDEDYDPNAENDSAGSEIDEDDEIDDDNDGGAKKKSTKTNAVATNNNASKSESKDGLVIIDDNDDEKLKLLWSEMQNGKKDEPAKEGEAKVKLVTKQYDFAGETVVIQEEVKVDAQIENCQKKSSSVVATTETNNENNGESPACSTNKPSAPSSVRPPFKRAGGLSSVLGQLTKKPKMSTLTKSLHDWNDYKKTQNIEEELDQHRRSKNSFLERQAFLDRTDNREFAREKSIRDHERSIRELNKPK